jgi:hypothetical protein
VPGLRWPLVQYFGDDGRRLARPAAPFSRVPSLRPFYPGLQDFGEIKSSNKINAYGGEHLVKSSMSIVGSCV